MAKLAALLATSTKLDGINPEIAQFSELLAKKVNLVSTAERLAVRSAKPWNVQMQHARQKADHKERTTETAKKKVQSAKDEVAASKEKLAKAESEYHDRRVECDKCHDDIAVLFSTKPEADSSDDGEDGDDDNDYTKEDMRGTIARLEHEIRAQAIVLAKERDDRRDAGSNKRPPSSGAISVNSAGGSGGEEDDFTRSDRRPAKRLVLGPSAVSTKLARLGRGRRSRSRHAPRIQKDDDPDAIMDATGTGKVYPA
jgi:hypothetical protein